MTVDFNISDLDRDECIFALREAFDLDEVGFKAADILLVHRCLSPSASLDLARLSTLCQRDPDDVWSAVLDMERAGIVRIVFELDKEALLAHALERRIYYREIAEQMASDLARGSAAGVED